jgi:hypothetical protein
VRQKGSLLEYQARASMIHPLSIDLLQPTSPERHQVAGDASRVCRVDDTLEDSFPASDPPQWSSGIARPRPASTRQQRGPRLLAGAAHTLMQRIAALF